MLLSKVFSLSLWQGRKKVKEKQKQMRIAKQALKGQAGNTFSYYSSNIFKIVLRNTYSQAHN